MKLRGRAFLKRAILAVVLGSLALPGLSVAEKPGSGAKNILLLVAEDMAPHLGCYGDAHARTPKIDQLAGESTRFDNAYVTAASCSPSRASMLTGLYPQQHGQIGLSVSYSSRKKLVSMKPGIVTLPQRLEQAGYQTGVLGKIHVDPHDRLGFDFRRGADAAGVSAQTLTELPVIRSSGTKTTTRVRYSADVEQMTRDAAEFFTYSAGKPFFLMVNFSDAHEPYMNQVNGYPAKMHQPQEFTEPFKFTGRASLDRAEQREMAAYYNGIARLDAAVGQILHALDKAGLTDNTLVMFLSDHGPEGFGRAKLSNYEAGLKVPFLFKYPGLALPRTYDGFVSSLDIMPTALEAANISYTNALPGKSLVKVLTGKDQPHEDIFGDFNRHLDTRIWPIRSVRHKDYKLIYYPFVAVYQPLAATDSSAGKGSVMRQEYLEYAHSPEYELFDLSKDPYELNNLAKDPLHREALQECKRRLRQWQEEVGDLLLDPAAAEKEQQLAKGNIQRLFRNSRGKE